MAIYLIEGLDLIKNQYIHYQVETQTILSISSLVINSSPGDCTKEYIYKRACEDLKSLYGDSILEKYYISHCVQLLNYPDRQMFEVRLKRTIGEYKTDSEIRLIYNGKGELSSLGTTSLTTFNFVEHLLNEKTLKEAEKEAHTLMGNKLVSNKELVMHIDGYLCIRFKLITGYEENGMPIETSFYYRVE